MKNKSRVFGFEHKQSFTLLKIMYFTNPQNTMR